MIDVHLLLQPKHSKKKENKKETQARLTHFPVSELKKQKQKTKP